MKKNLLTAFLTLFAFLTYSQAQYHPGYFIDNENRRVECLIDNTFGAITPIQIKYRVSENDELRIAGVDSVREFGFTNTNEKYIRAEVAIDQSSGFIRSLDYSYTPVFKEKLVFLKVLILGAGSLYSYNGLSGQQLFFYSINDSPIEQLIYKRYRTKDDQISENVTFKQQLLSRLECKAFSEDYFAGLSYREKALLSLFQKYNECVHASYEKHVHREKKGKLSFAVKGGMNRSTVELQVLDGPERFYHGGVEIEYIFPTNVPKASVFLEPTLMVYRGTYTTLTVDYTYVVIPFGLRRHFILTETSKVTAGAAFAFIRVIDPEGSVVWRGDKLKQPAAGQYPFVIINAGYTAKGRYSIEAAYHFKKVMLDTSLWTLSFPYTFSVTAAVRIGLIGKI